MRSESFGIETYSPYQDRDLGETGVFDAGDLELSIGDPGRALGQIEAFAAEALGDGKLPVMLGGEHLVTLGALRAAIAKHPDLHILHFDAHADLRDEYLGLRLSHATVMRRAWELTGDGRIHQFGVRSGDRSEFAFAAEHVLMHKYDFDGLDRCIGDLSGKPVYFTLDLDVLDPSVFPGTGTPEAGGVGFPALLDALLKLGGLRLVGCDLTELCPVYDQSGASTALACKILRELLLAVRPY
jgi:agmatinase